MANCRGCGIGMWHLSDAPFFRRSTPTSRTTHIALIVSITCLTPDDQYYLMVRATNLKVSYIHCNLSQPRAAVDSLASALCMACETDYWHGFLGGRGPGPLNIWGGGGVCPPCAAIPDEDLIVVQDKFLLVSYLYSAGSGRLYNML